MVYKRLGNGDSEQSHATGTRRLYDHQNPEAGNWVKLYMKKIGEKFQEMIPLAPIARTGEGVIDEPDEKYDKDDQIVTAAKDAKSYYEKTYGEEVRNSRSIE